MAYIDDGSGKLHDKYKPDLSNYDGMMVEKKEPELGLADNLALQKLLWDIWRLDKTPPYGYDRKPVNADTNGSFPSNPGCRFGTPRDIIEFQFRTAGMDIWLYNKEQLDKST